MSVRVGIVGLGGVAHRIHVPACHPVGEIEIVGACDPSEDARAAAGKLGVARTIPTCDELLERTSPEVIIVGTPPGSHFEICWRAMQAGAHVFCEKPFVPEIEQADRLIELARSKNLLLRVNNQYRFMSFYRETKESINAQIPRACPEFDADVLVHTTLESARTGETVHLQPVFAAR